MPDSGLPAKARGKAADHQMRYVSAQQDHIGMLLRQMGADVKQIHGLVCFVRFHTGGTELLYVYILNADDAYYLQRVKPYPMSAGVFPTAAEIAEYIEKDLRAFERAAGSGGFANFVAVNRRLTALVRMLEETYLRNPAPEAFFREANTALDALEALLRDAR